MFLQKRIDGWKQHIKHVIVKVIFFINDFKVQNITICFTLYAYNTMLGGHEKDLHVMWNKMKVEYFPDECP